MTTVAFDGQSVATDAQMGGSMIEQTLVEKGRIIRSVTKDRAIFRAKFRVEEVLVVGAGDLLTVMALAKWVEAGRPGDHPLVGYEGCEGLVISADLHRVEYFSDRPGCLHQLKPPIVLGSGSGYAMGAMLSGASAERAAEIACALDPDSGQGLHVYQTDGLVWKKSFRILQPTFLHEAEKQV